MNDVLLTVLDPFLNAGSRTFWGALAFSAVLALGIEARRRGVAAAVQAARDWRGWGHASGRLDLQLLFARQLLAVLATAPALGGAWWIATHGVRRLDHWVGAPPVLGWSTTTITVVYSIALFVAWDLSRYVVHRLLHEVDVLWSFHQVHHSAEVLSPLTFHRVHPVESLLYQVRGAVTTGLVAAVFFWLFRADAVQLTLFGVHGLGLVLNGLFGNLRHSEVWLSFGAAEALVVSPAQHQLHHSVDPEDFGCNYGTWLALWDRLGGSWKPATTQPAAFGILGERNHTDHLLSAWFGPFLDVGRRLMRPAAALSLVLLAGTARAQEEEDDDDDLEIVVESEGGVPRAAGSAHVLDEEDLERFEFDDVHQLLKRVPGVYVRGEEGFGLRPNIGIRGANSDRSAKITLMEDGVLLAPAPYASPAAYYFPMSTRLAGIEVFKGPAATRHGPHTVGGAINTRTRDAPTDGFTGYADLALGARRSYKAHGYTGVGDDRWGLLAEVAQLGSGGFKVLDGGGKTGFDRTDVMLKTRWSSDRERRGRHTLELKLGYGRELSHETYLGLALEDAAVTPYRRYSASSEARMRWHRSQAELAWEARLGDDIDVRTVAYHHFLTRQWTKLNRFRGSTNLHSLLQGGGFGQDQVFLAVLRGEEDSASSDQELMIGTNDRRFHSFGVQSVMHVRSSSERVISQLEVGLRIHGDEVRRIHTEVPHAMRSGRLEATGADTLTLLEADTRALAVAAHVHEDLGIGRFRLLPGLRVEAVRTAREDDDGTEFPTQTRVVALPGLGLHGEILTGLSVFGGAHRGFSPVAPGQAEDIKPESSWSYELGMRGHNERSHGEVVGFLNDYVNLTGACTLSGGCVGEQIDQQFNGGKVWVGGIEAAAGHTVALPERWSLSLDGNYTWTHARFRTGFVSGFPQFGSVEPGDRLPYLPEHQGSATVVLAHPRFSVNVGVTARSGMRDVASQGPITNTDVPALGLLDVASHIRVHERLELYGSVSNALGASGVVSWRPFGARPVPPMQIWLGLKIREPG